MGNMTTAAFRQDAHNMFLYLLLSTGRPSFRDGHVQLR
jgi:hypothetical protein